MKRSPVLSLILVLAQFSTSYPSLKGEMCSDAVCGCIAQCSFSALENAMKTDENQYNLWTAFHLRGKAFPRLLAVIYKANITANDTITTTHSDIYLWTLNSIYFVIPPDSFGFLSLYMGALSDEHSGCVHLTIPEECSCWLQPELYSADPTQNYLEVLTDKVYIISRNEGGL